MTKLKKKIGVALCAFALCAASIAATVSIFGTHTKAVAEDVAATSVIKAEDLVTELSDSALASETDISVRARAVQVTSGLNDADGFVLEGQTETRALYSQKATTETAAMNSSVYDGNLGVYMSGSEAWLETGFAFKQTEAARNKYVSFRMKYEPLDSASSPKNYVFSWTTKRPSKGYGREWMYGYNWVIVTGGTLRLNYVNNTDFKDGSINMMTSMSITNNFFWNSATKDVIVTFGAVEKTDTSRDLYFQMKDSETGTVLLEQSFNDAGFEYTATNGKPDMSNLGWYSVGRTAKSWNTYIGGVDGPLVNELTADYNGNAGAQTLENTVTLPTGYAWENPTQAVKIGGVYRAYKSESYFTSDKTYYNVTVEDSEGLWMKSRTYNAEGLVSELSDEALASQAELSVRAENSTVTSGLDDADGFTVGTQTEIRALYSKKATTETAAMNSNAYDGNLGVYMNYGSEAWRNTGVVLKQNEAAQNKYVSLRMKYEPKDVASTTKNYVFSWTTTCPTWGYTRTGLVGYNWFIIGGTTLKLAYVNGSGNPQDATNLQMTSLALDSFFSGSESKDVVVTFGAVENADETRDLYFKMVDTSGNVLAELSYNDASYTYETGKPDMTELGWYSVGRTAGSWNTYIGGVNEPLVNKTSYEVTTGSYNEEALLSTVTLPAGYAFKDTSTQLTLGTNTYAGTYTYSYFGNEITSDCDITVTANSIYPNSATVKLMAGTTEIGTETVRWKENETGAYTLPTQISNAYGALVGWFNGNDLLKLGSEIELANGETVTLTVADIEFGVVNNSAEVRKIDNANGKYGMRFLAKISTEQYAALGNSIAWKFFYANTDEIVSAESFTTAMSNRSGVGTISSTFDINENYKGAYVGLSSLNYQNYNLTRSVRTFVTVTYADSTTADFYADYDEAAHSANIVDVVKKACLDETLNETERETFLNYYVNATVEIVDTDGTFTVIGYEDGYEGLNFARTYVLQSASVSGGSLTLTVEIDVDGALYEGADTPSIPVTVYKKVGETYEKIRAIDAQIAYVDGVATITFAYGN